MNPEFLKPSFSRHPCNFLFLVIAFFIGFLTTSFVFAGGVVTTNFHVVQMSGETMTQLHNRAAGLKAPYSSGGIGMLGWSGYSQVYKNCNSNGIQKDGDGPNRDVFCDFTARAYSQETCGADGLNWTGSYCQTFVSVNWYEHASGNCPVGTGDADGDGICNKECPAAGTQFSGEFATEFTDGVLTLSIGGIRNVDDCQVAPVWENARCYWADDPDPIFPETICRQIHHYEYNGLNSDGGEPSPGDGDEEPAPDATTEVPPGDHTQDAKNYTAIPKTTETMPDGTTVDQEGYVESETRQIGPNITQDTTTTVIKRSNGMTKTTNYTKTTTVNPDGIKTVDEETTVSYSQSDMQVIAVQNDDGYTTITNNPGYSGGSTSSKSTSYDAEGNMTGSSESTSYDGDEEGKGEAGQGDGVEGDGGTCEENPQDLACMTWTAGNESGDGFPSAEGDPEGDAWAELSGNIDSIKAEAQAMFSFNQPSGVLGCYEFFTFRGTSYSACLDKFETAFNMIGQALLFIVLFLVLFAILRD
jgi:hypothetical protein